MIDKLDNIDREILKILQKDAKTVAKSIAQELGLTKTPVYERIKRLEQDGFIKNYVAILDKDKIEESITVFSFVSLETQKGAMMDEFFEDVKSYPEVVECFVVGGEFDFLLKVVVKNLDAYYDFAKFKIASLPSIGSVKSAFVLNEVKNDTNFPLL
ncbi:MAG: Lrp/AsnC family transcriptional regulator [Maribacter arcticus]|jgi:Lrp/AsnC family leucine-responsive transcriptional regulator|uniref:DNA-binding transcriptional regulator, Lrp family n=1 Tax=Maribacter arcticus TaxID=561365 RepID=A0A1T5EMF4_9FLAO|nr:Lrp/AsnC family transcriptional regulator [Maribacter arcticus]SKB85039.1 DNA-binding transcriptional regulator, Lrp family [Maribacter arcticus]|tara:strand:- start:885 stop:1352 length:468 start_codon:yes stop_codon:yes gene_type:complete